MTTVVESSVIKEAVRWIGQERAAGSSKKPATLAEEAALRFDLSPADAGALFRIVMETPDGPGSWHKF